MFLNDLSVVCKYFGGLQSECKNLILQYGPLVFDYIAAYIVSYTSYRISEGWYLVQSTPSMVKKNSDMCA